MVGSMLVVVSFENIIWKDGVDAIIYLYSENVTDVCYVMSTARLKKVRVFITLLMCMKLLYY